jgi:acetoin utilization deacetylase AcuC-like enzyme
MAIVYHQKFLDHYQDAYHPESPERLIAINTKLEEVGHYRNVLTPKSAQEKDLEKIHTAEHIEFIKSVGEGRIDMDTKSHEETFDIAMLACGGAILAAETSYSKKKPVMALLRPPGHHAGPDYCGGFCYFNNIALAAEHLRKKVDKVAIVDIDVHHGNGTSDIFCERSDVLYISTHQWGIFPGTGPINYIGERSGEHYTINIPLTSRCGDTTFENAFDRVIEPVLSQFEPKALLVSIGGDAHYMDPLANLTLSSTAYVSLAQRLMNLANKFTKGQIAFYLEGGYHTGALAEVIAGIVGKFKEDTIQFAFSNVYDMDTLGKEIIDRVVEIHGAYWKL